MKTMKFGVKTMGIAPAYGRDYTSKKTVLEDWNNNRDFIMTDYDSGGRYVNRSDLRSAGFLGTLKIRYSKNRKVMVLELDYSRCVGEGTL